MNLLEINSLEKTFGDLQVIKGISLKVKQGEVVAIIGPSGSGKSTLLRCAAMLETPDSGDIIFLGDNINSKALVQSKPDCLWGMVFQNFNLFPHFSVIRNVIDPLITVKGMKKPEALEIGRELLAKMDLSDKEASYPYQLSGGQQQRVSIARALALDPKIIYFDEPTSALDPELTGEILKVVRKLADEDMTMVIVTHEISFARDVADRIIFMDDGVIVEEGSPEEVINKSVNERTRAFLSRFTQ